MCHVWMFGMFLLAGGWFAAVLWAHSSGWIALDGIEWWLLAGVLPIAALAVALRKVLVEPFEPGPWDDHRVIRSFALRADGEQGVALVMELVREFGAAAALRVEFRGVAQLRLSQFDDWVPSFSSLQRQETPGRRDGLRFHVFDPHNEMMRFRCREIAQLRIEADAGVRA